MKFAAMFEIDGKLNAKGDYVASGKVEVDTPGGRVAATAGATVTAAAIRGGADPRSAELDVGAKLGRLAVSVYRKNGG